MPRTRRRGTQSTKPSCDAPTDSKLALAAPRGNVQPINKLPDELLAMIMLECVEMHDITKAEGEYTPWGRLPILWNKTLAPLTLSAVSRHWRQIALNTPHLWSRIRIGLRYELEDDASDDTLDALELSLARAGAVPISLQVTAVADMDDSYGAEIDTWVEDRLTEILVTPGKTWHHLDIDRLNVDWDAVLDHSLVPFSSLASLKWEVSGVGRACVARRFLDASEHLRELVLHVMETRSPVVLGPRGSQLTSLELGLRKTKAHQVAAVLLECPNIEHCVVEYEDRFRRMAATVPRTPGDVVLPKLRTLRLISHSDLGHLLNMIKSPTLESLFLGKAHEDTFLLTEGYISASALSNFLSRSQCRLTHLKICACMPDDMEELSVPHVQDIWIKTSRTYRCVLSFLACCPGVEICTFSAYGKLQRGEKTPLPTRLEHLTKLRVRDARPTEWTFFFRSLAAPRLELLELSVPNDMYEGTKKLPCAVPTFVKRWKCSLTTRNDWSY